MESAAFAILVAAGFSKGHFAHLVLDFAPLFTDPYMPAVRVGWWCYSVVLAILAVSVSATLAIREVAHCCE